jgi:hypothetical protein
MNLRESRNVSLMTSDFYSKEVSISHKTVYFLAYFLLAASFPVFLLTHVKLILALPLLFLFVFGLFRLYFSLKEEFSEKLKLPISVMILLIAAALLFSWLAGQGGFFPQKSDHLWRNALLRDLIMEPWPVAYEVLPGSRLVYYYNFWLIPAAAAKLFLPFGERAAVEAGHVFLFLWTSSWLFTFLLFCCCKLKVKSLLKSFLFVIIFFFFSGMDCIGFWLKNKTILAYHLEWWTYFQYSSVFTQLAWVFNQAVPAWLCVILIYDDEKTWHHIAILSLCCLYAPFPAVGLAGIVACLYLFKLIAGWRNREVPIFFKKICSAGNIEIMFSIIPVMALFYLSNGTASAVTGSAPKGNMPMFLFLLRNTYLLKNYFLFIVLEFLIIILLLWKKHRCDIIFYAASLELFVLPMFYIVSSDFCMRVSIPALCFLAIFTVKFLISEETAQPYDKARKYILILILMIGAVTPIVEIGSACYLACKVEKKYWRLNQIYTFTRKETVKHGFGNFVSKDASQKFFFRYLAKPSIMQSSPQQK